MARRKTQPDAVRTKYDLAERLRMIRTELYGDRGGPELARRLGVPIRTWYNYESGVTVPSEVLLRFIELTSVEPVWLLNGHEPRYRTSPVEEALTDAPSVEALLRTVLHRLESRPSPVRVSHAVEERAEEFDEDGPADADGAFDAHSSVEGLDDDPVPRTLLEHPDWIAAQNEGRCVRVEGDAMVPIVADGAFLAFAEGDQEASELEGKLVVAWISGRPIVRWFEQSGRYALLRAENPNFDPPMTLLDLEAPADVSRVRRVLWIGTPH
jgi:SOS-response transcriptional repressor LexA